jgi:hypothetical protein
MRAELSDAPRVAGTVRAQAWVFIACTVVAFGGGAALLTVAGSVGLYAPPTIGRLGIGTFDGLTVLFVVLWTWTLHLLSINDGREYGLQLGRRGAPWSRASDVVIPIVFGVVALGWGLFGVHRVSTERAADPTRVHSQSAGASAQLLHHGAAEVTTVYFVVVGIAYALALVARLLSPVDLDGYRRHLRGLFGLPAGAKRRS